MSIIYKQRARIEAIRALCLYLKSVIIRIYSLVQHESCRCGQKRHQHPIR